LLPIYDLPKLPRESINNQKVDLDVYPKIIDSRTMVPIRFVSEALGAKVDWEGETKTVIVTTN
jgi:hypothetical protein